MLTTMFVGVGRWGRTEVTHVQGKSSKSSFTLGLKRNASENDIPFSLGDANLRQNYVGCKMDYVSKNSNSLQ